ncbi:MAG: hypothetical protein JSW71_17840 [Gemmatimonadota bacterium]|nr:MAG: hypothetical protein JSW71_17840 [Gemmatimonadota bacterium]
MKKRPRRALYLLAGLYFLALAGATALWSVRNDVAQFLTLEWCRDVALHLWSLASADLLSAMLAAELAGLVVLGYLWWLADVRKRTWPRVVRKLAPLRRLMAVLALAVYLIVSPVAFLMAYLGFRDTMTARTGDRRVAQDPNYTGPERRAGAPRRTIQRHAFAGHPGYHTAS